MVHQPEQGIGPPRPSGVRWYETSVAINDAVGEESRTGSNVFIARYGGRCAACGEGYKPGDRIRYAASDVIIHEGCEDADVVAGRETEEIQGMGPRQIAKVRANMCSRCFVERLPSGACGNCDA